MSSRPQPCEHSVLVSYLQAGLLRGCMQTSCCSCYFTLAFRMWTTEVLKILVGEAEHLQAPPCTSMHLHAPPCTSMHLHPPPTLSRLQAGSTIPPRAGKGTKTAVCHQEMHNLNLLSYSKVSKLLYSGWTGNVPSVSLDIMENLKDDFCTTERSVKDGCRAMLLMEDNN